MPSYGIEIGRTRWNRREKQEDEEEDEGRWKNPKRGWKLEELMEEEERRRKEEKEWWKREEGGGGEGRKRQFWREGRRNWGERTKGFERDLEERMGRRSPDLGVKRDERARRKNIWRKLEEEKRGMKERFKAMRDKVKEGRMEKERREDEEEKRKKEGWRGREGILEERMRRVEEEKRKEDEKRKKEGRGSPIGGRSAVEHWEQRWNGRREGEKKEQRDSMFESLGMDGFGRMQQHSDQGKG